MLRPSIAAIISSLVLLALPSCSKTRLPTKTTTTVSPEDIPAVSKSVTDVSVKSLQQIRDHIAQQSGKVVVLDLWALW